MREGTEQRNNETRPPIYRLAQYRIALVRERIVSTGWDRQVRASQDVATLMGPLVADLDREAFWVVLLNGKNRAIGLNLVSIGALTATLVHPREVLKPAILGNAAAIILVHNHPSGDPAPSAEDFALTKRLWAASELMGIRVLDHVVIGHEGAYSSLADQGALGGRS
jgi:DNA repair protein RadC